MFHPSFLWFRRTVTSCVMALAAMVAVSPCTLAAQTPAGTAVPADVQFMQGMIGHHAQAVELSALVATRTRQPAMQALAERIAVSQRDEMAIMRAWLAQKAPATGGDAQVAHGAHAMHEATAMPGMLSPVQLDSLRAANGPAFDALFLRYMIQHHEGALQMVATLLAAPRGAHDPQVFQFAADVDADQRAEIRRMRSLLSTSVPPAR